LGYNTCIRIERDGFGGRETNFRNSRDTFGSPRAVKKLKNKQWLDRHARILLRKELRRRYRYNRKYYRTAVAYQAGDTSKPVSRANRNLNRNLSRNRFDTLIAPQKFSLHLNPEETLSFFSDIEAKVCTGHPVNFDMAQIEELSIDTIMYFLASLKRWRNAKYSCGFKGSVPSNDRCRKLLESSGFFNYVKSSHTRTDLTYQSDVVQISNGQNADTAIAKKICDFTMRKLQRKRQDIRALYDMIIELMSNTKQHAYVGQCQVRDWYIFVSSIPDERVVRFIFLDTGEGIPTTVRRTGFEYMTAIISHGPFRPIGTSHTTYIQSALEGKLRSRTGKRHRGKGLPKIYSFYNRKYISKLTIISNRGYYAEGRTEDMTQGLKGTMFYWELS
jgi:hypothetical protein